jgi:hypothetical protein
MMARKAMSRSIAGVGLAIGLAGLILQFAITIPASMAAGRSLFLSVVYYFSFFTILTNIVLVLVYAGVVFERAEWLALIRRPITAATAATTIALVMGFYHFVLADLWHPQGLFLVCDVTLHYVTPILYLGWFVAFARSQSLALADIPKVLIYPLVYVAYALLRGAIVGEYPYPVLEANRIGYGQVVVNSAGLLLIVLILGAVAIGIDRIGGAAL